MNSGPQSTRIPNRDASMMGTMVRRLCGHASGGPRGFLDQSSARISAALSLLPGKGSSRAAPSGTCEPYDTAPSLPRNQRSPYAPVSSSIYGSDVRLALPDAPLLRLRDEGGATWRAVDEHDAAV